MKINFPVILNNMSCINPYIISGGGGMSLKSKDAEKNYRSESKVFTFADYEKIDEKKKGSSISLLFVKFLP